MPNGLPIASTTSPTRKWSAVAKVIAGSFGLSTLSTARSVSGSVPTTRALSLRESASAISIWSTDSTTW
ncbi:hypothetical protein D3C83_260690 [compost metagenome]